MKQYIESKGYAVGCYSDDIDKLSKNAHKNRELPPLIEVWAS